MTRNSPADQSAKSWSATGKPGATATPVTLAGGTASGAPSTGAHTKGEVIFDDTGAGYYCTVAGTPGTWVLMTAAGAAPVTAWKLPARLCQPTTTTLAGGTPSTVDGYSVAIGDRILVINQSASAQNGIYTVQTVGSGANGTWVRATDMDTASESTGATVLVQQGLIYAGSIYYQGATITTLGTDGMLWVQSYNRSLFSTGMKTSGYTAEVSNFIPVDTSGGAVTITMPTVRPVGSIIAIQHNAGANPCYVTVSGATFNAVSGLTIMPIPLGSTFEFVWDTSNYWYAVSRDGVLTAQLPQTIGVPAVGSTQMFTSPTVGRVLARSDIGTDAMVDYRRVRGKELRRWKAVLGNRDTMPANVVFVGDSVCEGAGATAWNKTWNDIVRDALQREYRSGGEGYIPFHTTTGMLFPKRWTLNAGVTETDFGVGLGRRGVFMSATTHTATLTAVCDRFYIIYTAQPGAGTFKVTVDGAVLGTQSALATLAEPGRIYDSGPLPLGTHTIIVQPNAAANSVFMEGAMLFATDELLGVHVWNGGHGGHMSEHYNGDATEDATAVGERRMWATQFFQPHTRVTSGAGSVSSNGATPSTLTWTGGTFDANDVGEVVFFGSDVPTTVPRGVRIVTVTDTTHIIVNKTIAAGTYTMAWTRARYTDVTRTSGLTTLTSATAAFNPWDVGKTVNGTGLLAGTTIRRVIDANNISVYPGAFSTGVNGTLQIINRQAKPLRPDLFCTLFGGNDMFNGRTKAAFKANLQAIFDTMVATGQLDLPTMTGVSTDERPSVCMMNVWSVGLVMDVNLTIACTSGGTTVSANTTGTLLNPRFTQADVGKVFSGAPVNGLTIATVAADGQSCTVSGGTCTATTTATAVILLSRAWQESQFYDFRQAIYELSIENDWMNMDLFNLGGNVGLNDNLGLMSYDNIHPNDRGQQWIADEFAQAVGGLKKLATIPQGIFDTAGEIIVAGGPDLAIKSPGIKRKITADTASGAVAGTMVSIPEWAFNMGPGDTLSFQFFLIWTTAAATSGILFDFLESGTPAPSAPADLVMACLGATGASAFTQVGRVDAVWGTDLTITGGIGTAVPNLTQICGSVTAGAVGGLITPRFGPEAAAATTLQRGSFALIL